MKTRWSDLNIREQRTFGDGCGMMAYGLKTPDFIFGMPCRQHDFYYARGGGLFDKLVADWQFYCFMVKSIRRNHQILEQIIYFKLASIYFLVVLITGWFAFNFGPYLTKTKILALDKERKKKYAR